MPVGNKNKAIAGLGSHHIAVQTRNWDESEKFYTDVMGMKKIVQFGSTERRAVLLDIGDGSHMELFEATSESPKSADEVINNTVIHFALTTTDIEAAVERVRNAGMEITTEIKTLDLGHLNITIAFFTGPSGEVVEFFQVNN
jgi:catechol 2,3-dioxygenase-like lactoylglutathione lyase family enzyme